MPRYYLLFGLSVVLTAVAQLFLKKGADSAARSHWIFLYLNIFSFAGYILMLASTLIALFVLKYIPLKSTILFTPFNYILVLLLSLAILKEKISRLQIAGIFIIIAGMAVYNL
jgi:drug/metabolite transporter (DMT)-like permease